MKTLKRFITILIVFLFIFTQINVSAQEDETETTENQIQELINFYLEQYNVDDISKLDQDIINQILDEIGKYSDPNDVFPINEVNQLIEKANNLEIEQDFKSSSLISSRVSYGTYPKRKGVILVTDDKYKGLVSTGHAAIIYSDDTVVEALTEGVVKGENNWNTDPNKKQVYAVAVKQTTKQQDEQAADWCHDKIGLPYNYNYYRMDYRDKFYCSHLIRSAFLDLFNIDLDTESCNISGFVKAIHPMELVETDKTVLIYRKK